MRRLLRFTVAVRGVASEAILAENAIVQINEPDGSPATWYAAETGGASSTDPVRSNATGEVAVWVVTPPGPAALEVEVSSDVATVRAGTTWPLSFPAFVEDVPLNTAWAAAGPISQLPVAAEVPDGFRYYAEDERLGYVKKGPYGGGLWVVDRPGLQIVECIEEEDSPLGDSFTLTAASTNYGVPGFATAPFEFEGGVIEATAANLAFSQGATATNLGVNATIQFTKDGGATWQNMGVGVQRSLTDLGVLGIGWVAAQDNVSGVATSGRAGLVAGDTIQVRLAAIRANAPSTAVRLVNLDLLASLPYLLVKQG
jgi:hypothetical protein